MIIWFRGLAKSRDKLKAIHLHYHSAYGHLTWQSGDLPYEAIIYKVTQLMSHVVLWGRD